MSPPVSMFPAPKLPLQLDMWGIACYFNSGGSSRRLDQLKVFAKRIRQQGLPLLVVECCNEDAGYEVDTNIADIVVPLRSRSILWQKERLLNHALSFLPATCDSVVWCDCDILLMNDEWVSKTRALLKQYVVVQLFENAYWLKALQSEKALKWDLDGYRGGSEAMFVGAVAHRQRSPNAHRIMGHEGFAWAIRRDVLANIGFYEHFVLGGADTIMASAIFGLHPEQLLMGYCSQAQIRHVKLWMTRFYQAVQGRATWVKGDLLHLWHGSCSERRYLERLLILKDEDFDPLLDVAISETGAWVWSSEKPNLHGKVADYFRRRSSDLDNSSS